VISARTTTTGKKKEQQLRERKKNNNQNQQIQHVREGGEAETNKRKNKQFQVKPKQCEVIRTEP
jgi:diphthamide synthase (EF-2-diphthine--ammonia ligase)